MEEDGDENNGFTVLGRAVLDLNSFFSHHLNKAVSLCIPDKETLLNVEISKSGKEN